MYLVILYEICPKVKLVDADPGLKVNFSCIKCFSLMFEYQFVIAQA